MQAKPAHEPAHEPERFRGRWHEFRSVYGRVTLLLALMAGAGLMIVAAFVYNAHQRTQAAHELRANTYALCVIQNENRTATRRNTIELYGQTADWLRFHRDDMTHAERQIKKKRARRLEGYLRAQRPLKCETYTRPDIPPDKG